MIDQQDIEDDQEDYGVEEKNFEDHQPGHNDQEDGEEEQHQPRGFVKGGDPMNLYDLAEHHDYSFVR